MGAAGSTDAWLLDSYEPEWRVLREHPSNLLLEGPVIATEAVLHLLLPDLAEPTRWHPNEPLDPPGGQTRTLVLGDVAALSRDDQRRLLAWSGDTTSGTQIISMTARPLFDLVAAGVFDVTLYYRLNVIRLRVGVLHHQPEEALAAAEPICG